MSIKLQKVLNKEYYYNAMKKEDPYMVDFLFRIKSINDNETMSFNDYVNFFDELDTDILDEILDAWEDIRFKIDDINEVTCPHCGFTEDYQFDEIEKFFPSTWFKR